MVGDRLTYDRDRLQQVLDSYPSRPKEKRMQDQTILANMYNSYKNNFANKIKFYPMAENLSMYNVHCTLKTILNAVKQIKLDGKLSKARKWLKKRDPFDSCFFLFPPDLFSPFNQ